MYKIVAYVQNCYNNYIKGQVLDTIHHQLLEIPFYSLNVLVY